MTAPYWTSPDGQHVLYCGDCVEVLPEIGEESLDMVLTSPPYDNLRTYKGHQWSFEGTAKALTRTIKTGCAIIWIVGDQTKNGTESGTSFRQALYFLDCCGLNLHQTLVYQKTGGQNGSLRAYYKRTDYMFVLCKGLLRTFNPLCDKKTQRSGLYRGGGKMTREGKRIFPKQLWGSDYSKRTNVWTYNPVKGIDNPEDHPAPFPEPLARDHILSWSNPDDRVLDPFAGSCTTGVACIRTGRRFIGIEIDESYCAIGAKRMEEELRQPQLFPPSRSPQPLQEGLFP